jgi:PAS domain S-box-containing protein
MTAQTPCEDLKQRIKDLETELAEQKQLYKSAQNNEKTYQLIIETMNDGLGIQDKNGVINHVNGRICEILKTSPDKIIGRQITDFLDSANRKILKEQMISRQRGQNESYELVWTGKDGEKINTIMKPQPIIDEAGNFQGSFAIMTNITERREAEEALRKKHQELESRIEQRTAELLRANEELRRLGRQNKLILVSAGEGIFGVDSEGRFTFVNPAAAEMLGYEHKELIGRHSHPICHHSHSDGSPYPGVQCPIHQAITDGKIHHKDDEVFWHRNGSSFPVDYTSTPIREEGKLVGAVVTFLDITLRKQAEERLRESEELYRNIYNTAPLAFVLWDHDCKVTAWNIQAEKIFGWSANEVVGRDFFKFLVPENIRPQVGDVVKDLLKGRIQNYSVNENLTKTGEVILCEWSNSILYDNEGNVRGAISLALDITERKKTEDALRKSEERFRLTLDATSDGVWDRDLVTGKTYYGENWAKILGYTVEDMNDPSLSWKNLLHPDDKARAVAAAKDNLSGRTEQYNAEFRLRNKAGEWQWILSRGKVVEWDENDKPMRFVGTHKDISDRKRVEEALEKSSNKIKMFAYSVAHDLKNPAIAIFGLTKHLQKHYGNILDEKGGKFCDQILKSSEEIAALVETINLYISTKETPIAFVGINVKEILLLIREEFSAQLTIRQIRWSEPEDIPEINADRLSIVRVMRNFIDNALKYGGDKLSEIEIRYKESDEFHILSVKDDGIGLKQEESKGIFKTFRRKKTSIGVKGTGLGLAIVKEIAEQHQGHVSVEHGRRKGITFLISISKYL